MKMETLVGTQLAVGTDKELSPNVLSDGPTHTKDAICGCVVDVAVEHYGPSLRAIVLTGSLARDEASVVPENGGTRVLGDAEFFLVFRELSALPSSKSLDFVHREIEARLSQSGVAVHVGLSPVRRAYFKTLKHQIFTYELKAWGRVLWGDDQILALVPAFR